MADLSQLSDIEILTLTIIGEARGEVIEGQIAVGSVIRNRVNARKKSYYDVCLAPLQFSCWNSDDPNRPLLDDLADRMLLGNKLEQVNYIQCQFVARGIVKNEILDNTHGALNYLTTSLFNGPDKPRWASDVTFGIIKGKQTFFTA